MGGRKGENLKFQAMQNDTAKKINKKKCLILNLSFSLKKVALVQISENGRVPVRLN